MTKSAPAILVYTLAFLSGACVLVLEILGLRLIGPYFGVTVFLWSALLAVTLLALAGGYWLGGSMADRTPQIRGLATPLALAGFWVLCTSFMRGAVLGLSADLGLRSSVLVASLVLFAPPLLALGTVSPYLVRLQSHSVEHVGRKVGNLYAVATLGSVAGALLTGYYLIPVLGIGTLMLITGAMLLGLAAVCFLVGKGKSVGVAALLALLPVCVVMWLWPAQGWSMKRPGAIHVEGSPYATVEVTEEGNIRRLYLDGALQNTVDKRDGQAYSPQIPVMQLPVAFIGGSGNLLLLGLGAGSLARGYHELGWHVEAVEIDPAVIGAAYAYFGLDTSDAAVFHADARQYLRLTDSLFDVIAFDASGGSLVPFHLVTREALALARARLREGGLLLYHIQAVGRDDPWLRSLAATLAEQFPHVWALPLSEAAHKAASFVLVASGFDPAIRQPDGVGSFARLVWSKRFKPAPGAPAFTDDHNFADLHTDRINRILRDVRAGSQ